MPDFRVADATAFTPREFGVSGFDRILISYALSMIPDWEQRDRRGDRRTQPRRLSCTSSISASRSACRAGSGTMLQAWLASNSTSRRAPICATVLASASADAS